MNEDASRKPVQVPVAPVPEPQAVPRSGSGADTALDAMIKKRKLGPGSDATLPGGDHLRRKPQKK